MFPECITTGNPIYFQDGLRHCTNQSILKISQLGIHTKPKVSTIICGLRNGPRKPMWRSRVLSTEAIQAVQSLKLAQKSNSKLDAVFRTKLSRLLKDDLLDVLAELQRQNELQLALEVFTFVRNEHWYLPDISLYNNIIKMLGRNKMIEMAEKLFSELKTEGLKADSRTFSEMMGAYFMVDMVPKALDLYEQMKDSGYYPEKLTFTILIRNLEKAGEDSLAVAIKNECFMYFDNPKKFIKEIETTYPKRRSLSLI